MLMTPKLTSAPYSYALIWRFVCPTTYSRFVLWHRMEVTNLMCPKPNFPYPSHKLANLSKGNCIFQLFSTPKFKLFLIAFFLISDICQWMLSAQILVSITSAGSSIKQESSRKTSISALLTIPKPLTVWITINCEKF